MRRGALSSLFSFRFGCRPSIGDLHRVRVLEKKLDELLGSLINPIWERVLRAPWWLRLLILILLAPVAYGLYAPESVGHYLKLSTAIARVARTPGHRIPISAQTLDRVNEAVERLAATLEGDIASPERPEINPWVMAQETLEVAR